MYTDNIWRWLITLLKTKCIVRNKNIISARIFKYFCPSQLVHNNWNCKTCQRAVSQQHGSVITICTSIQHWTVNKQKMTISYRITDLHIEGRAVTYVKVQDLCRFGRGYLRWSGRLKAMPNHHHLHKIKPIFAILERNTAFVSKQ